MSSTTASRGKVRQMLRRGVPIGIAALGVVALSGCGSFSFSADATTKNLNDTYKGVKVLDLRNNDGATKVVGSDAKEVTLKREQTYTGDTAPEEKVSEDAGTLSVEAGSCGATAISIGYNRCDTDYTITVPYGTKVLLRSDDGTVDVDDTRADIDVESRDGGVTVTGEVHDSVVRAQDGAVELDGIKATKLDVKSRDGDITATGSADTAKVTANDGAIDLDGITVTTLDAVSRDGGITVRTDERFDAITAKSNDGDIALTATKEFGSIKVSARDGGVDVLTPGDGGPYAVETSTRDGGVDVSVPTDKKAESSIDATSNDGSISVKER